jgi:nucleotide-binding universal stress UspA family protein
MECVTVMEDAAVKTILVPVDFSDYTATTLDLASELAAATAARIALVHVAPAFVTELRHVPVPSNEREFVAQRLRQEHRDLQALAKSLDARGCEVVALMIEGPTVTKLLDEIHRLDADLVVMGSHGHGRFHSMVVGSVCDAIVRQSPVPVMVVPRARRTAAERADDPAA